ncbi:MAG: IPT/TIG domain-containing protein [bacterium]
MNVKSFFVLLFSIVTLVLSESLFAGTTDATIAGIGLSSADKVRFHSEEVVPTDLTDTSISVVAPDCTTITGTPAVVQVILHTDAGWISYDTAPKVYFTCKKAELDHISPDYGPATTEVTFTAVTGSNFASASGIKFGAIAATSFTVLNNSTVTAVAPAGSGRVTVYVTNPMGDSVEVVHYDYPATIASITPDHPSS